MKKNIHIKQANIDNIEDIVYLLSAYRSHYKKIPASAANVSSFISERISSGDVVIFLAYAGENAVGITQLYSGYSTLSLGKIWFLYDLYIAEEYRNLGVGKQLLEVSKNFATLDGAFRLELKTEDDNITARGLYETFGFSKDDMYIHYRLMLDD